MVTSELTRTVAQNVRKLRADKGLTQTQLAEAAGLHRNTIAQLETLRMESIRLETLDSIARVLGVEISDLIAGEPPRDDEVEQSWHDFLASALAEGITDEEKASLRKDAFWPWGRPTVKAWYHALEALRASRRPA